MSLFTDSGAGNISVRVRGELRSWEEEGLCREFTFDVFVDDFLPNSRLLCDRVRLCYKLHGPQDQRVANEFEGWCWARLLTRPNY